MKSGGQLATTSRTLLILSLIAGAITTLFITYKVFGSSFSDITSAASWQSVIFVNILVGVSVSLFVLELRAGSIRVLLTVVVALIFGFLMTMVFTLDTANRLKQGEFKVQLLSDAEVIDNDEADIEYGRQRGDEFNKPNAAEPITEQFYHFAGLRGDVVTVVAVAANRRSEVNLQVELLSAAGEQLADGFSMTPEQVEAYEDARSESDAIIENFELPADGLYTIHVRPENLPTSTVLRESFDQTKLAYEAFLLGPITRVNRWGVWIQDAITLILLGLAFAVVFRANQFSLGAEGQLYFGALVSGLIALQFTSLPTVIMLPLALIAACTAGFLWGLVPGVLKAYLGANELVSTLMLNVVAIRFYELVLTFQLKPDDAGYIASDWFPTSAVLPSIVEETQVTVIVFLLVIAIIATWLFVRRTPIGYEIRMIGANIKFADYGGINTRRTIMLAMALSGILAGLAGAHLAMGIHRKLILNISFGLAFEGVVVTLLARNNVLVVPFTGLLYSYLRAGAQFMERDANVSFEVVRIIQAIIILLITAEALVAFFQQRQIYKQAGIHPDSRGSSADASLPVQGASNV